MTIAERNDYVINNLKLIHFILRDYRKYNNYEEIFQSGVEGMIVGLDRTIGDVNLDYLGKYIRGYANRFIIRADVPIVTPDKADIPKTISLDYEYQEDYQTRTLAEMIEAPCYEMQDALERANAEWVMRKWAKEEHKDVIRDAMQGYNMKESCENRGYSHGMADILRKRFREDYEKSFEELEKTKRRYYKRSS